MIQITINNLPFQLGQQLPNEIHSAVFITDPRLRLVHIPSDQALALKHWFNQFIDNCKCEYVVINNTYIPSDELVKFEL